MGCASGNMGASINMGCASSNKGCVSSKLGCATVRWNNNKLGIYLITDQVQSFYLVPLYTVSFLVTSVSRRYIHTSLGKARPVWDQRCRQYSTQLHSVFSATRQDRMTFFQPKLGPFWIYLPSGANKKHTVVQSLASGHSGFFWLLKVSISRIVPTLAGRMTFYLVW